MAVEKLTVACEFLEQALRLYYESYHFSAIHLAGAAEELLGAHLTLLGQSSTFHSYRTAGVELANALGSGSPVTRKDMEGLLNHAKNRSKHMDLAEDNFITFDPAEEARELLDRAVSDYYHLMQYCQLPETPLVARFNREVLGARGA
ncbi:hypothetical protein [Lysobacter sp.]|uniref:hypothetical protein n=1 Tax=Lysobacter sp. TaxID=72226 RepID=UPI002D4085CF|nr:hypothetical protein [Lysobacter sp.]HZX76345.1 hypothetical protein [Lysobacter sp.]